MTDPRHPLAGLKARSGDTDFLRVVAEILLRLLMEADADGVIGAGHFERSAERQARAATAPETGPRSRGWGP